MGGPAFYSTFSFLKTSSIVLLQCRQSCYPVGVEGNVTAKWLFSQEKATLKELGDAI
jgi:hypothetical protein